MEKKLICYESIKRKLGCEKTECRFHLQNKKFCNCLVLASKRQNWKLEEIGKMFNLSLARIGQIEKESIKKLKRILTDSEI